MKATPGKRCRHTRRNARAAPPTRCSRHPSASEATKATCVGKAVARHRTPRAVVRSAEDYDRSMSARTVRRLISRVRHLSGVLRREALLGVWVEREGHQALAGRLAGWQAGRLPGCQASSRTATSKEGARKTHMTVRKVRNRTEPNQWGVCPVGGCDGHSDGRSAQWRAARPGLQLRPAPIAGSVL